MRIENFITNKHFLMMVANKKNHFLSNNQSCHISNFMNTDGIFKPLFAQYGTRFDWNGSNCAMVFYVPNKISIYPIYSYEDALSFNFSGCYMATFKYEGRKFVAHIAMDWNKDIVNYWNLIVQRGIIRDCILFNPTEPFQNLKHKCYWGLITSDGECFIIDYEKECNREYDQQTHRYYYSSSFNQYLAIVRKVNPLKDKEAIINPF